MITAKPGDVLAVRGGGMASRLIRFGAAMRGAPNLDGHIAVLHHLDDAGTLWAIEGRPGGVGWRDAKAYFASPWTVTNAGQPKTAAQRAMVCERIAAMLGTSYDWEAIAADAAGAFGLADVWRPSWHGTVPGHVVCSSLAAYAYDKAGLQRPDMGDTGREVTPADWVSLIIRNRWGA